MVGANQPSASNIFATSETRARLVRFSRTGSSEIVSRKESRREFNPNPRVLKTQLQTGVHSPLAVL